MQIPPLEASESQGRIWGRGACDVKGAMAAMITALDRAVTERTLLQTIVLAFTVNKECGFTGAKALSDLWLPDSTHWDHKITVRGPLSLS